VRIADILIHDGKAWQQDLAAWQQEQAQRPSMVWGKSLLSW